MATVYLIEDDPILSQANAEILTRRGHQVFTYASGGEALLALYELPSPELLVLDTGLPDMCGLDVVRWVRQQRSRASLPIVVTSGSCGEVSIREALRAGANDYLVKPVSSSELGAKVGLALERRRAMCGAPLSCELLPGDVAFGRWRVAGYLGSGAYGTVYGVRSLETGESFALKVLKSSASADRGRFLRECYTLAACQHPSVPRVEAYGEAEGRFFLVTEWVRGMDLATYLELHGALSEHEAIQVLEGLARALVVLEQEGIVHRDLKPGNVLLRRGRVDDPVLVDFGLAKYSDFGQGGLTTRDVVMGTPGFLAPEVVDGEEPGPAADVYALGLLGRLLLTAQVPFPGLAGHRLVDRMRGAGVDMEIGVSSELQDALLAMTRPEPRERIRPRALAWLLADLLPNASLSASGEHYLEEDASTFFPAYAFR